MMKTILKTKAEFSALLFCHTDVLRQLNILGLAMIAVSLLYLMAANWWMIPKFVRLIIPMFVLICSAMGSLYFAASEVLRQSFDTISGLMLGLGLAVIGQIYQTGADSYLLFLVWAILLLPWLYRPNIGIFVMLTIISQLALYFYFKQSFWMERAEGIYVIALNSLSAATFIYAMRHYSALRYVFIAFFVAISIGSMLAFIGNARVINLASVFVLPLATAFYFYRQYRVLECTLLIAGVAFSLSLWVLERFSGQFINSAGGLFVLALLIFMWFAAISFVLTRLFPKSTWSMIPLAIGAWIAGIVLAVLLLTFWETISIVMGVVFIGIAWILLHRQTSFFIRQFAYCLWVCGQIAVLVHLGLLTDNLWWVWLVQLVMLCLSVLTRKHWLIVTLQLIASHALWIAALVFTNTFAGGFWLMSVILGSNAAIFILMILTSRFWQPSMYMKSVVLWALMILGGVAATQMLLGIQAPKLLQSSSHEIVVFYLLPCIFVFCLVLQHFQVFLSNAHQIWLWLIPVLGLLLVYFGYFGLFVVLVLWAWATVNRLRWVQGLCILLLMFWLWMLYYRLDMSFLSKSLTIFISGVMLLFLVQALKHIGLMPATEGDQV